MKRPITALLLLALASCNVPAFAEDVTVEETPANIETMHETAASIADILGVPPSDDQNGLDAAPTMADGALLAQGATAPSPLLLQGGTGRDTRLSVDTTAINERAEREGWATWQKWTVVGVCVVAVAVASVLIVDACQRGEHSSRDDNSSHLPVSIGGDNNTVTIHYDSPQTSSTQNGGYY